MRVETLMQLWVVEYSLSQKAVHIHQVEDAMKANVRMILSGEVNDYLMIAVTETRDDADQICTAFLKRFHPEPSEPEVEDQESEAA